ncbi:MULTISPECIES: hypothetical protein [unclassified Siphonobacter]|uniref:hypothetical protein n=1 Tax=unclassified Siphonobacter TaxID=2635712 RepID=UPI0012FEDF64|nr:MULTISPECIES: hypothetical protein [unclassified Siphonobacter]MDQ1087004.1 hypothetical protein [Siphonobacter sp. SORGH_AS_1065]MDR6193115.1 hypothetical protein [Siphonobacter sp. SORGH_AS_0500]
MESLLESKPKATKEQTQDWKEAENSTLPLSEWLIEMVVMSMTILIAYAIL